MEATTPMYNAPRHESLLAEARAQVAQLTEEQLSTADYLALFRAENPVEVPREEPAFVGSDFLAGAR